VADAGLPGKSYPPPLQPSLWLLQPNGELDENHWSRGVGGSMPVPTPLNQELSTKEDVLADKTGAKDYQLIEPVAVAVEDRDNILVLERGYAYGTADTDVKAKPRLFRYTRAKDQTPLRFERKRLVALEGDENVKKYGFEVIDMAYYRAKNGPELAILERGISVGGAPAEKSRIRVLSIANGNVAKTESIDLVDKSDKVKLITPAAIAFEDEGSWIVADARDEPDMEQPGTLFRVRRDPNSRLTDLLPGDLKSNPLVRPTGVALLDNDDFVVCDRGVKRYSYKGQSSCRWRAEPANLFRVTCTGGAPASPGDVPRPPVQPLTDRGALAWPVKVAIDPRGAVLVADQGERDPALFENLLQSDPVLSWRGKPHRLGVSVLFAGPKLDKTLFEKKDPLNKEQAKRRAAASEALYSVRRSIEAVIENYKPLHSVHFWKPY
jgi:hypothetical protein